jgi:integrase
MASIALELTPTILREKATIHWRPVTDASGKVRWVKNEGLEPYTILDTHALSHRGLRLRVSRSQNQRGWAPGDPVYPGDPGIRFFYFEGRVSGLKKKTGAGSPILRFRVGDHSWDLDVVRKEVKVKIADLLEGKSLVDIQRQEDDEKEVDGLTLGGVMDLYLSHMAARRDHIIKPGTIKAIQDAKARLGRAKVQKDDDPNTPLKTAQLRLVNANLLELPLVEVDEDDIKVIWTAVLNQSRENNHQLRKIRSLERQGLPVPEHLKGRVAKAGLSATEQTFRWLRAAIQKWLKDHIRRTTHGKRTPLMTINPVDVLHEDKAFRSPQALEADYQSHRVRNPLDRESLGRLLDELWRRRTAETGQAATLNRTSVDYLITLLFTGLRAGEASPLEWADDLLQHQRESNDFNWLDVQLGYLRLGMTKNGKSIELPLPPRLWALLRQRHADRALWDPERYPDRRRWVFPTRSSKRRAGYYSECKSILAVLRDALNISALSRHDFRRTFGRMASGICAETVVKQLLNHSQASNVTARYGSQSFEDLRREIGRIEAAILNCASPSVELEWPR